MDRFRIGRSDKVNECVDDTYEADWVVEEIKVLFKGCINFRDCDSLSSNAQSRIIEHSLSKVGIKYRVYGGFRFYDRAEVKNALAYLRLIENSEDDNALLRVINFLLVKLEVKRLKIFRKLLRKRLSYLPRSIFRGKAVKR